ncbi:4-(cytidine 5'-diphospho)-2-C-methyl-D-erythritol kinase [Segetibacter aerophilus]|uniref:4-diphosphocytidyl-2-C-methyl-D-erythritol kinase n=1 Tax=Segetibacter aerophilus TaxID=670293 RepID=A0A512B7H6_9BACT|nr:4-(cytidine 5'-diphospho)-2-C-methyl-D-erythritol kinase [Segetibacter aerophilus]GEO07922.1 4-diphosphocytidyl-2-C-methyl-D-erythritol kinase [Segetibacter aerophilus]
MVLFPNCKINLGLQVIGKRADGYHSLETVFYPVAIKDALEIIPSQDFSFQTTGLPVNGAIDDNLCVKAYHLLKKDFPDLPAVTIHLHKAIPMGAGLGGGSADGAFMLNMLNKHFQLQLSEEKLISYALQLGSDCPFFIINKPCFATGRGENLTRVELDLASYKIVLVNPGIHVSTKEAFARLTPARPLKSVSEIIKQPIPTWKNELVNDFEKTVFDLYPAIKNLKEQLYEKGALYASMTGSGSTVFGIFEQTSNLEFSFPEGYTCLIA